MLSTRESERQSIARILRAFAAQISSKIDHLNQTRLPPGIVAILPIPTIL